VGGSIVCLNELLIGCRKQFCAYEVRVWFELWMLFSKKAPKQDGHGLWKGNRLGKLTKKILILNH
jgi:hypothetical protein